MATMTEARVLPRDVFDTLEFSALAYGGIGAGEYSRWSDELNAFIPWCALGHANRVSGDDEYPAPRMALFAVGITEGESDQAVNAINRRWGAGYLGRVPFADWRAELGVVRGDDR